MLRSNCAGSLTYRYSINNETYLDTNLTNTEFDLDKDKTFSVSVEAVNQDGLWSNRTVITGMSSQFGKIILC